MQDLGITQMDLLKLFGVTTRGAIGHYLNGRRDPSPTVLPLLADKLEMSLDELLRGKAEFTAQERELIFNFRAASTAGQSAIELAAKTHAKSAQSKAARKSVSQA